ncbi:PIG-L deacetylase family protein [Streptomyces sp. NPDC057702]|uniref:PIG-L deacetylase family protein n=1 Tax=unclassified Streptomyces TaxID=2593676 RepID=UPI00368BAE24
MAIHADGAPIDVTTLLRAAHTDRERPWLFVSPHLDDCVLSAGGTLAAAHRAGVRTVVATVCAGDPARPVESPFARHLVGLWGLGADGPVAGRRAEDASALREVGARPVHLPVPDAVFRTTPGGEPLYPTVESVFAGAPREDDPAVRDARRELARVVSDLEPSLIIGPAGIGRHVDHVLVSTALTAVVGAGGPDLVFYEDLPYAATGSAEVAGRFPVPLSFTEADWEAKSAAAARYASQLPAVWPDTDALAELRARAEVVGARADLPAERLWCPERLWWAVQGHAAI